VRQVAACLRSEQIPPLPEIIRKALINQYFPDDVKDTALTDTTNEDCLVRIYLGKRADYPTQLQRPSLRNLPLHVNQIEDLQIDVEDYARAMAEALAVMHWVAKINGRDVEFVLGGFPIPIPKIIRMLSPTFSPTVSIPQNDLSICGCLISTSAARSHRITRSKSVSPLSYRTTPITRVL
jgi:hypothetical protein